MKNSARQVLNTVILTAIFFISYVFPAWAFLAILSYAVLRAIARTAPKDDRKYILTVIVIAVIMKIIILLAYHNLWLMNGKADVIGPDGEGFSQRAWYISRVLSGQADYSVPSREYVFDKYYRVVDYYGHKLPMFIQRGNGLFAYFIAIVYSLFGYVPLMVKSLNIMITAFSSMFVYLIGRRLYGESIGRTAILVFTFFPSIFIFSITLLRDPLLILCILAIVYDLIVLTRSVSLKRVVSMIMSLLLILFLRGEMFVFVTFFVCITLFFNRNRKFKIAVLTSIAAIFIIISITSRDVYRTIPFKTQIFIKNAAASIFMRNANSYRMGGKLIFRAFPDKYYEAYDRYDSEKAYLSSKDKMGTIDFLKALPSGVLNYLIRPLPSFGRGKAVYNLISFHMICWYVILLLSVFGLAKKRLASAYPVFIYLAAMLVITSMVDANQGIMLRHRDLIVPFVIILAAAGLDICQRKRY